MGSWIGRPYPGRPRRARSACDRVTRRTELDDGAHPPSDIVRARVRPGDDPRDRPGGGGALLRDRAADARGRADEHGRARRALGRVHHPPRGRPLAAHPRAPHRLHRADARPRGRVLARRDAPPATATTARPACGRSTGPTTTAASCSIRRATAPRPCTTTSCASAGSSTTCGSASPTSRRPSGSTWPSRRTPASASTTTRPSAPSSWAPRGPSRSSPERRRSTCT